MMQTNVTETLSYRQNRTDINSRTDVDSSHVGYVCPRRICSARRLRDYQASKAILRQEAGERGPSRTDSDNQAVVECGRNAFNIFLLMSVGVRHRGSLRSICARQVPNAACSGRPPTGYVYTWSRHVLADMHAKTQTTPAGSTNRESGWTWGHPKTWLESYLAISIRVIHTGCRP